MFHPEKKELKVFLSGVNNEFGEAKSKLKAMLKEAYGIEAYCNEADKEPDFRKTWPKLEKEIESSEIFILFLGGSFGAASERDDTSITQKEYSTAKELNRPIIVFRDRPKKFENKYQKNFYNEVINFHKDQQWAPSIEDIEDTERLLGCVLDYALRVAAEAIPVLNNEDEAGNFYVECRIHGQPYIARWEGAEEDTAKLDVQIIIKNKDKYSHLITDIWLDTGGKRYKLHNYKMEYHGTWIGLNSSLIKIKGRDKHLIHAIFYLCFLGDEAYVAKRFQEDLETAIKSEKFLKLGWQSI